MCVCFQLFLSPLASSQYSPRRCQKICAKKLHSVNTGIIHIHILCQQWPKLGQNNVTNVSALGFSISITVSTMTQIGKKIVSTMCQHWGSPYPLLCQQWHKLGQNSAKNVSALGFFISIIVSTMTQNGEK